MTTINSWNPLRRLRKYVSSAHSFFYFSFASVIYKVNFLSKPSCDFGAPIVHLTVCSGYIVWNPYQLHFDILSGHISLLKTVSCFLSTELTLSPFASRFCFHARIFFSNSTTESVIRRMSLPFSNF